MSLTIVPDPPRADQDEDGGGSDLGFDELVYLAERLLISSLSKIEWNFLEPAARALVTDDNDATVILKLMEQAEISVAIGDPDE